MRTKIAIWLVVLGIVFGGCMRSLHAQEQTDENKSTKAAGGENKTPVSVRAVRPYHLDFVIKEMEGGKKVNSRHYSTNLNAGEANTIKIGTRVPLITGKDAFPEQFQYMDVGTSIHCRLLDRGDDIVMDVHAEVSDFALPAQAGSPQLGTNGSPSTGPTTHPLIRQMQLDGVTLLTTEKPMVIASVDDPNSNREFQFEVTATKLK